MWPGLLILCLPHPGTPGQDPPAPPPALAEAAEAAAAWTRLLDGEEDAPEARAADWQTLLAAVAALEDAEARSRILFRLTRRLGLEEEALGRAWEAELRRDHAAVVARVREALEGSTESDRPALRAACLLAGRLGLHELLDPLASLLTAPEVGALAREALWRLTGARFRDRADLDAWREVVGDAPPREWMALWLRHREEQEAAVWARLLAGDPGAVVEALQSDLPEVRRAALERFAAAEAGRRREILEGLGPRLEAFQDSWARAAEREYVAGLRVLFHQLTPELLPRERAAGLLLRAVARPGPPEERRTAAEALRRLPPDDRVRNRLRQELLDHYAARHPTPERGYGDDALRLSVVRAYAAHFPPEAAAVSDTAEQQLLVPALEREIHPDIRAVLYTVVGKVGGRSQLGLLLARLRDPARPERDRLGAMRAVTQIIRHRGLAVAPSPGEPASTDPVPEIPPVVHQVRQELEHLAGAGVPPEKRESFDLRHRAVLSLGELGLPESAPALGGLLQQGLEEELAQAVLEALGALQGGAGFAWLLDHPPMRDGRYGLPASLQAVYLNVLEPLVGEDGDRLRAALSALEEREAWESAFLLVQRRLDAAPEPKPAELERVLARFLGHWLRGEGQENGARAWLDRGADLVRAWREREPGEAEWPWLLAWVEHHRGRPAEALAAGRAWLEVRGGRAGVERAPERAWDRRLYWRSLEVLTADAQAAGLREEGLALLEAGATGEGLPEWVAARRAALEALAARPAEEEPAVEGGGEEAPAPEGGAGTDAGGAAESGGGAAGAAAGEEPPGAGGAPPPAGGEPPPAGSGGGAGASGGG